MTFANYGRTTNSANYLPFDVPGGYREGAPMVFAHYFTQFPLRLSATPVPASDAVPGYYYQNYYAPGVVENGTDHRRYGGFTRDYPIQSGLTSTSTPNWEQKDMESEVRQAIAGGIGGWTIDMLSIRGYDGAVDTVGHWTRIKRMFDAVDAVNAADGTRFRIMLMPDGTSGATAMVKQADGTTPDINASADALANAISQLAGSRTMYRREGKLMVGPFAPEKWPVGTTGVTVNDRITFWNRFKATMQSTYGHVVGLWMCYVDTWNGPTCAPLFNTVAYGHGRWGDRDATSVNGETTNNRLAPATCRQQFGKPWMHFGGSPMDSRPSSAGASGTTYRTWESWGTRTIDGSWRAAIDGSAECNQIVTWNDYTEHAHVAPSHNNSFALLDLQYYYITRYRGGYYPAIVRDCLYLTHRVHRSDATIASNTLQVAFSNFDSSNLAVKNDIEVVVFATGPCTVEILNDTTVISTQTVANAGVTVLTTPLPTGGGTLSARMKRDSVLVPRTTVTSKHPLQVNPIVDDYHYRSHSSLRQIIANEVIIPTTNVIDYGPTTALGSRQYQAGDIPESSYTRTYSLPNLPSNGTTSINTAWDACFGSSGTAQDGDCVTLPAGTYVANGNLDVRKNGVTIKALGSVTIVHQNTTNHGLRIYSNRNTLRGKSNTERLEFKTTGVSGRGDQNEQGMATLLLAPGCSDFVAQDVTLRGAKAAGFFAYQATRYMLNRVLSIDSLADAFHNTNGSKYGMFIDCYSKNAGDDLMAFVHYDPRDKPSQVSTEMTVIRHRGYGNTHGRGFAVINCRNIYAEDLYYERTGAAGIILGREYASGSVNYQPQPVTNVTIKRATLYRCNWNTQDHGAVFLINSNGDQPTYVDESSGSTVTVTSDLRQVRGVSLSNVNIIDTNYGRTDGHSGQAVRAVVYSSGTIAADLPNFTFYGDNFYAGNTSNSFGGNIDGNSNVTRPNWTYSNATWNNSDWSDPA